MPARAQLALRTALIVRKLRRLHLSSSASVVSPGGPVVSLTSYGDRVMSVHLTIESIAQGNLLPSRLILWLDHEPVFRNPPESLLRLQRRGLEIRLTSNYGPHTKYYPFVASGEDPDRPLVTADDDILYPRHWLQNLARGYAERPDLVNCYRARVIVLNAAGLGPYGDWYMCNSTEPTIRHFATGVSGVIYPPAFLAVLRNAGTAFRDCCPKADDIWLHVQALRSGYKIRQLGRRYEHYPMLPGTQHMALQSSNWEAGNDKQAAMTYNQEDLQMLRSTPLEKPSKSNSQFRSWIWFAGVFCLASAFSQPGTVSAQGPGGPIAEVSIGTTPGRPIPPTFMGIAHEWGDAQSLMGSSDTGVNPVYRNMLSNLTAYGSGPIIVRVGGNSTDTSHEPNASTIRPFVELARDTGAHFYLGVNLGAKNLPLAIDQTKAFLSQMPPNSLDAIEIGNEPDSYVDKHMRPPTYPFPEYLNDFDTWRKQIYPMLPSSTKLIGPSWALPSSLVNAGPFLEAEHSYLYALSQHFYAGDACNGKVNPPDVLLNPKNSVNGPNKIRAAATLAHQYNLPFRIDELNSIACGGQVGVSDAFGSALWAIDIMFEFANAGVDGVNWQSPNGKAYSSMDMDTVKSAGRYDIKTVRPLYFGMLFFQAATGNHARLLPVSVNTNSNLKVWATIDATGVVRLVVINKSGTSGRVGVSMPGFQSASILRLTGTSPSSQQGVTFAGQSLGENGRLVGDRSVETVHAGGGGNFQLQLAGGSALLAEFRR